MTKTGVVYMKLIVSYGEPTELDPVGCDGLYIESCEKTDEVIDLRNALEKIRDYVIGGSTVVDHEGEAFRGEGTLLFMIEETVREALND